MLSLRTPNEEISGFFKVKEPGEHLSSYWIGSCFYIQKEEIRFWQRGCWLTLVRGRSTKVDCSPLFPNISSKTTCFEMMTLETLQTSCDKLCWDTWPSMNSLCSCPGWFIERWHWFTLQISSLYILMFTSFLCAIMWLGHGVKGMYLYKLNIPLHWMSIRRGSTRLSSWAPLHFFLRVRQAFLSFVKYPCRNS